MSDDKWLTFERTLEEHHQWPGSYLFKFIVPQDGVQAVAALFPGQAPILRPSAGGKYVSVSVDMVLSSAREAVDIYRQAALIPGMVSL